MWWLRRAADKWQSDVWLPSQFELQRVSIGDSVLNNNPRDDDSLSGSQSAYKALNSATSTSSGGKGGAGAGVVWLVTFGAGVVWFVVFGAGVVWFGGGVVWLVVFGLGAGAGVGAGAGGALVVVPLSPQPDKVKAVRPVAPNAKTDRIAETKFARKNR
jgi:hypothetical protein